MRRRIEPCSSPCWHAEASVTIPPPFRFCSSSRFSRSHYVDIYIFLKLSRLVHILMDCSLFFSLSTPLSFKGLLMKCSCIACGFFYIYIYKMLIFFDVRLLLETVLRKSFCSRAKLTLHPNTRFRKMTRSFLFHFKCEILDIKWSSPHPSTTRNVPRSS